jgi:hypothetical protein
MNTIHGMTRAIAKEPIVMMQGFMVFQNTSKKHIECSKRNEDYSWNANMCQKRSHSANARTLGGRKTFRRSTLSARKK